MLENSSQGTSITMPLQRLSDQIRVSAQTLVQWIDRHLVEAELDWTISPDNHEVRTIRIEESTLGFLNSFAEEYRDETVSRTEARRLLKKIDPRNVKRLIRSGDITTVQVDDDVRIVIGSIEDYLIERDREEAPV